MYAHIARVEFSKVEVVPVQLEEDETNFWFTCCVRWPTVERRKKPPGQQAGSAVAASIEANDLHVTPEAF